MSQVPPPPDRKSQIIDAWGKVAIAKHEARKSRASSPAATASMTIAAMFLPIIVYGVILAASTYRPGSFAMGADWITVTVACWLSGYGAYSISRRP